MPYYHAQTYHHLYGWLYSETLVNLEIGKLPQWNIDISLNMWGLEVHVECKKDESGHSNRMKQTRIIFTKKKYILTYVNRDIYQ